MSNATETSLRSAGLLLAVGSILLVVGLLVHPQGEGVSTAQTEQLVRDEESMWVASHYLIGFGLLVHAGAAIGLLTNRSRLTGTWLTSTAWTIVAAFNIPMAAVVVMESTALREAATANESAIFASLYAWVEGFLPAILVASLAVIAIAWSETRAATPLTPKWAAYVGIVGALAMVGFFVFGFWGGQEWAGNLFLGYVLMGLWLMWVGVGLWMPKTTHKAMQHAATG